MLFLVAGLLAPGCATQKVATVFETIGGTDVVYNFAYATKQGRGGADLASEKTLATPIWDAGAVLMQIPGESFEVAPVSTGELTLTKDLTAAQADVVWVSRGLSQAKGVLEGKDNWIGKKHHWDIAYDRLIEVHTTRAAAGVDYDLVAVEPSFAVENAKYLTNTLQREELEAQASTAVPEGETTSVVGKASAIWPWRGIGWHLTDDYSQLSSANKALLRKVPAPSTVKVAHLDTGYYPGDRLKPRNMLDGASKSFIEGGAQHGDVSGSEASHGARTLSTMAGGRATLAEAGVTTFDGDIGAFPQMQVAEYRISEKLPIHINAGRMARAIYTAAREGYDVVSISAGGIPSLMQRDAVNFAYESGTAIVAATGDFYTVPVLGPVSPSSVVFPARYNRVLGVAGVTADGTSYGLDPCNFCQWKDWDSWMLRGSYGPSSEMKGHTIAAYAPNITHSAGSISNRNAIALGGAGTSHATPQVAAAAAMWLEYHRGELGAVWNTWRKTEAVYAALLGSADTCLPAYSLRTMGEGTLKAQKALNTAVDPQSLAKRSRSTIGLGWIKDAVFSSKALKGYDERLAAFLREMLFTELQQVMFQNEKVANILEELGTATKVGPCQYTYQFDAQGADARALRRLMETMLKGEGVSNRLREVLRARLAALP